MLRSHSLSLPLSPLPRISPKLLCISLHLSTSSSKIINQSFSYGPSLHKGRKPSPPPHHQQNDDVIDRGSFTRVFELLALRVPSELCFPLESRLRGHLLNWPRVRNIARVPNDDIDPELSQFFNSNSQKVVEEEEFDESESSVSFNRRIYGKAEGDGELLSPVLYRDRLARTFDSKGFVKFRSLAKLSRPPRRREGGERRENVSGNGRKNSFAEVEVIGENRDSEEDLRGLLGEGFSGVGKWKGSTRLLLLDERLAGKGVEELPEAIKAVLKEESKKDSSSAFELVKCKITLYYDYWQMNEILEALLPKGVIVPSAFETVGHIAHLNLRDEHLPYKKFVAMVVLDKNKPKIQTVVNKMDAIHNDYRTMELEVLAGNHSLVTTVAENGLRFHVDLATVYWNSRLATERQRLLNDFTSDDIICDVFAGVGPIAVSAARKVKYVYANDLNPSAVEYLEKNCVLNKLERKIEVFNMEARRFIYAIFSSRKGQSITQVVMNLPNDAAEYLDVFRGIFRLKFNDGEVFTLPKIHVYGFSKAQDPEFDFHERIRIALSEVAFEVQMRSVRLVAPGKWMLCASFVLPESVALAKPSESCKQLEYERRNG